MLVSKATKLLKLGHSDFDQVYAMSPADGHALPPSPRCKHIGELSSVFENVHAC